jgi:hypothetical protein
MQSLKLRRLVLALVASLILGGLAVLPATDLWRPTPVGTWYFATGLGPGMAVPGLVSFHDDGTLSYVDGLIYSGLPQMGMPLKLTSYSGVWRVTGLDKFGGTSIALMFDPSTGAMTGFMRARSALRFDRDTGQVVGRIYVETSMCASPVVCPDPTDASLAWTPFGDPVNGFPVTLSRMARVPAGPLP